jgi:hypothetical protein
MKLPKKVEQFYKQGFWKACLDIFVAWLVPVVAIFAFLDQMKWMRIFWPLSIVVTLSVLLFAIGMLVHHWNRRHPGVKGGQIYKKLTDEQRIDILRRRFKIYRASEEDVRSAAELAQTTYPLEHDRIPESVMLAWYQKNPEGFHVMRNMLGDFLGNLDLLALKPDVFERFKEGNLLEREIRPRDLYSPEEKEQIRYIHIESFVVCMPHGVPRRDKSLGHLYNSSVYASASTIPHRIRLMCHEDAIKKNQVQLCAISANPDVATRLLEIGAKKICDKERRRDEHDLYLIDFAKFEAGIERVTREAREDDEDDDGEDDGPDLQGGL